MTALQLWWITLAAGVLVILVVALLLTLILRAARRIARTLDEIWTVGQSVANNAIQIDLLRRSAVVSENLVASLELSSQYARSARSDDRR